MLRPNLILAHPVFCRGDRMNQDITSSNHPINNPIETLTQSGFTKRELSEAFVHDLQEKLTQAEADLKQGKVTEATAICHQIIKVCPTCDRAYKVLGNILLTQGKVAQAGRCYQTAIASQTKQGSADDYMTYFNRGNDFTKQGNLDQGIECYQKALAIYPHHADSHLNLGILWRRKGQLETAIAHYRTAIDIQPDLADAYVSLGNVYFQLNQYDKARDSWQQALKIQPNVGGAELQVDLGNALVYLNQIDGAIQQYEQTIQLDPDCLKAYYNLANLFWQQENLEAAIATYRKALKVDPKFIQGYLSLGELLEKRERYDEAIATYLEILTIEFHESITFHKLGNVLTKKGHLNDAEIFYSRNIPINLFKKYAKSSTQWNLSSKESPQNQSIYIDIYPRSFHYLSPPETIETELHYRFKEAHFTCPPTSVTIVPEGRIGAADYFNKIVFDAENQLVTDISTGNLFWLSHEANIPSCEFVNQTIAYISVKPLANYYHWMADLLPRIELIRQSGIPMNSIDRFLINPTGLPIQAETLNLLGIPLEKIWLSAEPIHIKAKELIIPSLTGSIWYMSKWVCDFLRRQFLPLAQTNQAGQQFPEKIYICRESKYRRIVNEPEVIAALREQGFAIVRLESLSFLEQVALFANAKVVISAHGSGLTNIVFCQPGTKVLELFASNYIVRFYWKLSNLVQLAYYYLIFEQDNSAKNLASLNPDRSHGNDQAYEDFMIHLDRLFALMNRAEV
jgi:tetratricopeptide (TPR) repeat protein